MRKWALLLAAACGSCFLSACSAGIEEGDAGSASEAIVRAKQNGGPDQVVMLLSTVLNGQTGELFQRSCSGVYYSSRVVATAAHCLDADPARAESVVQVLVYYGNDFAADFAQLPPNGAGYAVPSPGQPSTFAAADSFQTHPDWDRTRIYPDLGVVYLDRALPFEPLPLARFRLSSPQWDRREATISGWGANNATTPTTGSGGRVQRTGKTRLLGSPTQADYHPEDPNPGILQPAVRQNVLKIDGRPPFSNACFGDSGGPLLVKERGRDHIAGIEYFGGLSCEEYSLYTRVEPFLPFFDEAVRRAGRAPLQPKLECVAENQDGSLTAFFGYDNQNGVSVSVPYGSDNSLPQDVNGFRPQLFRSGEHHFVFGVDFNPGQKLVYKLAPSCGASTKLVVTDKSTRCGEEVAQQAICGQSCRGQLRSGCTGLPSYEACIDGCNGFYEIFADAAQCALNIDDWNRCLANTTPGPDWMCFEESSPGAADGVADVAECTPFIDAFFECAFGG
ncbi:MAG: trypsin-like serine protease [Myxococcales bacterium]|nr:MAG: trypsin-like serine protease [Myxococcales bacterium]